MITLTQNEEKILTKIRQLSLDKIQKLEEFIDQLLHSDNLSLSDEQTEKKIILVRISINV
jgi:hypothetical protein